MDKDIWTYVKGYCNSLRGFQMLHKKVDRWKSHMKFEIQSLKKVEKVMKVRVVSLLSGKRRVFE